MPRIGAGMNAAMRAVSRARAASACPATVRAGSGSCARPASSRRNVSRASPSTRSRQAVRSASVSGFGLERRVGSVLREREMQLRGARCRESDQRHVRAVHVDRRFGDVHAPLLEVAARGSRACTPTRRPGSRRTPAAARASAWRRRRPRTRARRRAARSSGSARPRSGSGRSRARGSRRRAGADSP